ncbi:uncharacterized protein L3040_005087 [Drepanopeziza brunnea f. sp. 'multigermtubi']|uniref:uncharacterized protein n=1 Tax=Drepanopeziza brunnea f. sp. 'multigermtubi' TaxID=698441 RepID=UPI002393B338|nr:hypothetical protein L3040_005087 [Drepanopeziza brunnea f. sp. 'multigermtubi']
MGFGKNRYGLRSLDSSPTWYKAMTTRESSDCASKQGGKGNRNWEKGTSPPDNPPPDKTDENLPISGPRSGPSPHLFVIVAVAVTQLVCTWVLVKYLTLVVRIRVTTVLTFVRVVAHVPSPPAGVSKGPRHAADLVAVTVAVHAPSPPAGVNKGVRHAAVAVMVAVTAGESGQRQSEGMRSDGADADSGVVRSSAGIVVMDGVNAASVGSIKADSLSSGTERAEETISAAGVETPNGTGSESDGTEGKQTRRNRPVRMRRWWELGDTGSRRKKNRPSK